MHLFVAYLYFFCKGSAFFYYNHTIALFFGKRKKHNALKKRITVKKYRATAENSQNKFDLFCDTPNTIPLNSVVGADNVAAVDKL